MTKLLSAALVAISVVLAAPAPVEAHGGGVNASGCHKSKKGGYHCHHGTRKKSSKRSSSERAKFRKSRPCPSTGKTKGKCPGYHVDHVRPLACGGADKSHNMQWLTAKQNLKKGSMGCRR